MVFTDEWGGGLGARCRENDPNKWGANAIFHLADNKLKFANYYKMPAAQGDSENCVAHNGSLVPVPGRDIKVQAWYQGGISVMDFTDADAPKEIAYFDRGPIDPNMLVLGGRGRHTGITAVSIRPRSPAGWISSSLHQRKPDAERDRRGQVGPGR